jgi:lipopolysaccharide export system protein LptC
MWRRWLIVFIAISAVAVVQLLWRQLQHDPAVPQQTSNNLEYRISNFTLRIIAADGVEQLRIAAPELIDQGQGQPSRLQTPVVTSSNTDQHWQISSDRALLYRQQDEAEFLDNVVVHNLDNASSGQLETTYLRVNLQNKTIHSPELVTISRPGLLLQGIGLQGDIDTARYHLLSEIQATYVDQ